MAALLPSRVLARLGSALRSWQREEQQPLARRGLPQALWWLSAAALLALTGLALRSQIGQQHQTRLAERQEALNVLQNRLQLSLQTVGDWGHWNEMHAYVDTPDPTFLDVNIRKSSLLQSEGVMVVFNRRQEVLFSADRQGLNAPGHQSLIDCLRPDLAGLRHLEDTRLFLCDGPGGEAHVGSILPISDSRSEKPANGTIAFLLPLRASGSAARSQRVVNQLLADLRLARRDRMPPTSANLLPLGQQLLTSANRQVLLRRPSPWEGGAGPLRTALALVVLGSCGALALRIVWMLERRRQRLAECRLQISRRLQQRRQQDEQHRRQIEQKLSSSLTAASVAHEIQQPLSTILLHCRLALQDLHRSTGQNDPPAAGTARERRLAQRLESLSVEAQRAAQITETMRMLLRNVNTPHHPVNLQTVVDSSLLFFRRPLSEHGIRLQTDGLDQPTLLTGDATQLQSALNNLIQNAITATAGHGSGADAGLLAAPPAETRGQVRGQGPILRIALVHTPDQIRLIVADSGPGFTNPERALAQSGSSRPDGGLGLFVVRTTMENHGGSLHIGRSAELGGAEVQLRWPCPPQAPANPASGTGGEAEPESQDAEGAEHHHR